VERQRDRSPGGEGAEARGEEMKLAYPAFSRIVDESFLAYSKPAAMKTESTFISQITSNWMVDEPRLRYADWLDKTYRSQAAEFIRVQCEWDSTDSQDPRFHELGRREFQLRESLFDPWLDQIAGVPEISLRGEWRHCVDDSTCMSTPTGSKRARRAARNLMRRARRSVSHIAERLFQAGYRFVFPEHACVRVTSEQFALITDFQVQKQFRFPVSLTAFLLEIGSVNFMGTHPKWPFTSYYFDDIKSETPYVLSDPMVVDAWMLEALLPFNFDKAQDILRIEIAPDEYHKSGVSGGGCQAVNFKNNAVEATIEDHAQGQPDREFVEFLENAISWCGFPGFAYATSTPAAFLDEHLRSGLLPL
jgi:uncharacterized protein (TIGR02996 family)